MSTLTESCPNGIGGTFSCVDEALVSTVPNDTLDALAQAVSESVAELVASLSTMWVSIGTPNLMGSGSPNSTVNVGTPAPNLTSAGVLLDYMLWGSLGIALLATIILGATIGLRLRSGQGLAAVGRLGAILAGVILMTAAGAIISAALRDGPADNVAGATLFLQRSLWGYMLAAALASTIIGGARMAWQQRAEPGRDVLKSLLTLIVVAGSSTTITALLIAAADEFSAWVLQSSLSCDGAASACFAQSLGEILPLADDQSGGLTTVMLIFLGGMAILTGGIQIVLMLARAGMLVILAGILPLSASFTNTETGKSWFRKSVGWLIAFILYKPAAAIVYSAAFQLMRTDLLRDDDALMAALLGLMMLVLAIATLPAMMRLVAPMTVGVASLGPGSLTMAPATATALPTGAAPVGRAVGSSGRQGVPGAASRDGAPGAGVGQQPSGGGHGSNQGASAAQQAMPSAGRAVLVADRADTSARASAAVTSGTAFIEAGESDTETGDNVADEATNEGGHDGNA